MNVPAEEIPCPEDLFKIKFFVWTFRHNDGKRGRLILERKDGLLRFY